MLMSTSLAVVHENVYVEGSDPPAVLVKTAPAESLLSVQSTFSGDGGRDHPDGAVNPVDPDPVLMTATSRSPDAVEAGLLHASDVSALLASLACASVPKAALTRAPRPR
jgi:hypothetical protein